MKKQLEELDNRMYNVNANLSALIHIQKIKTKQEAEGFLSKLNSVIADWIKEIREIYENINDDELTVKLLSEHYQAGREELAEEMIKIILKRKDKGNIGTLTRIYSYCKKQINQDAILGRDENQKDGEV